MLPWCRFSFPLLLAASTAIAQTTTSCNPLQKTCLAVPALSSQTYTHDFTTQGPDPTSWTTTAGTTTHDTSGLAFTITVPGYSPTIYSKWSIFFGRVSFFMRAAPGTGIVSCAILLSDDLDELDWEWLGGAAYVDKVSSNYFGKGNTTTYDRAQWEGVANTQSTTHNYTIGWTKSATTWYIDGAAVRMLNYADAVGGRNYPQTPMSVRVGIWAGGDSGNKPGVIEWAGGTTDYADGPFTMYLEKIEVVNDNPANSYSYGDFSGNWESIRVNGAVKRTETSLERAPKRAGGDVGAESTSTSTSIGSATAGSNTQAATRTETVIEETASPDNATEVEERNPAMKFRVSTWLYVMLVACLMSRLLW